MDQRIRDMIEATWETIAGDVFDAMTAAKQRVTVTTAVEMTLDAELPRIHGCDPEAYAVFSKLKIHRQDAIARAVIKPYFVS